MSKKTWGGRFKEGTDTRVEAFTESISFDRRLYHHDIIASKSHARMLAEVKLISTNEAQMICDALSAIEDDIEHDRMPFTISLEDIHSHIERALIERIGDTGRKLHTGRSRNDQVATDLKLWLRDEIDRLNQSIEELQTAFVKMADRYRDIILPGYTHLQRAQPILAGHYCLAYVEKFHRDRTRLYDCRKRLNTLPLGAAALAGTSLPIDRGFVQKELHFDEIARNSLDISSDRDFVAEAIFCLSMVAVHLSGWSEEWILWASAEFHFLILPDAFCTGSSIMPQKKNPDVLELTRGKTGRVIGCLQQILVMLKGLPLAYNRDLQEDKLTLFDACDTISSCLSVAIPLVNETLLNEASIASKLGTGFLDATTVMEGLIQAGMPMRSAHEAVGHLVQACEKLNCQLVDLPESEIDTAVPGYTPIIRKAAGVNNSIQAFRSFGSTAPAEVERQIEYWKSLLKL